MIPHLITELNSVLCGLQRTIDGARFDNGCGTSKGPFIAMTDDSSAERNALHSVWQDTQLLLCTFHFLQRKWTWLHDGNNRIADKDRAFVINKISCLC